MRKGIRWSYFRTGKANVIICRWALVFSSFKSSLSCRSCCHESLPVVTETAVGFMKPLSGEDRTKYEEDLTLQSNPAPSPPPASTSPSVFLYSLGSGVLAALKTFLLVRFN